MLIALLLPIVICLPAQDGDEALVEALRDAQATHREAWSRGRARVSLKVTTPGKANPCIVKGDILWSGDSFILTPQTNDPDEVYFVQSKRFANEGNFIARGDGFVATYSARQKRLQDRDWAPLSVSVPSIFVLSPRVTFGNCCPPHADPGRPWIDMIGPSPSLSDAFKTSKFTHRRLPNGDIEQTRQDEERHKFVTVFSTEYDLAVASAAAYDRNGKVQTRLEYSYRRNGRRGLLPATCICEWLNPKTKISFRYEYEYSSVVIPDSTPPSAFTRAAVLARIRSGTGYSKLGLGTGTESKMDDAALELMARDMKENGTAKP
jgi:hypothetical protein